MKQQKYFKLSKILFGLMLCLGGKNAMALSCSYVKNSLAIDVGNIVLQHDVAAGQSISNDIAGTRSLAFTCTTAGTEGIMLLETSSLSFNSTSANGRAIFNTNMPGIGIALGGDSHACARKFMWTTYEVLCRWSSFAGAIFNRDASVVVQLYKTGPSGSGSLSGQIGYFSVSNASYGQQQTTVPITISGNVTTLACSINTPNIQVPLGNIMADSFTSLGSVYNARQFNVGLNCDAGARINVTLTGTRNTDTSTAGVLQLTNAGSANVATGVGVQILYNGSPMTLGNKITLKTSAGGAETFPFTAQYYQTAPTPTAGAANATATLEIVYQ